MHPNELLITRFYEAFKRGDYKIMQACYANDAIFNDPVFKNLNSEQVKGMWEMFCVKSKDLKITYSNITANEQQGSAEWRAEYSFSKKENKVINSITAHFLFKDGKIINHSDSFNFYKWARQALGLQGLLLGWTRMLKNKVSEGGLKRLNDYILSTRH